MQFGKHNSRTCPAFSHRYSWSLLPVALTYPFDVTLCVSQLVLKVNGRLYFVVQIKKPFFLQLGEHLFQPFH